MTDSFAAQPMALLKGGLLFASIVLLATPASHWAMQITGMTAALPAIQAAYAPLIALLPYANYLVLLLAAFAPPVLVFLFIRSSERPTKGGDPSNRSLVTQQQL